MTEDEALEELVHVVHDSYCDMPCEEHVMDEKTAEAVIAHLRDHPDVATALLHPKDWPTDDVALRRHDRPNPFLRFGDEELTRIVKGWAADQREREWWRDGDTATYRYRADLLDATAERIGQRHD